MVKWLENALGVSVRMESGNGFFNPTRIGDFNPTDIGVFSPTATQINKALWTCFPIRPLLLFIYALIAR